MKKNKKRKQRLKDEERRKNSKSIVDREENNIEEVKEKRGIRVALVLSIIASSGYEYIRKGA